MRARLFAVAAMCEPFAVGGGMSRAKRALHRARMSGSIVWARAAASPRKRSEDRAEILVHRDELVLVVADGAGGVRGGSDAADAVVRSTRSAMTDHEAIDARVAIETLERLDAELAAAHVGETTAVVAVLGPRGVRGVSCGDSEAWLVVDAKVDVLTEPQDRRRIGTGRARVTPFERPSFEGVLVLATDGLFRTAAREAIVAACSDRDVGAIAERLVRLARLPSGAYADDVAIIVAAPS